MAEGAGPLKRRRSARPAASAPRPRRSRARRSPRRAGRTSWGKDRRGRRARSSPPFEEAADVIERFRALRPAFHSAPLGDGGEGEEGRTVGVEAGEEDCAGRAVGDRVRQHEAERDGAVNDEIAGDVQESAEIGPPGRAGDGAVEPVREPAEKQRDERCERQAERDQRDGEEAESEPREGYAIGADAGAGEGAAKPVERRVDQLAETGVEHSSDMPAGAPHAKGRVSLCGTIRR